MKRLMWALLGCMLVVATATTMSAQQAPQGPPKVLTIFREYVRPGHAGMAHEEAESAFVQAFKRANWPTHYFAVTALSGRPRALFLTGYDSFAAWEKDNQATDKNAALSQALDRAAMADSDLLTETDAGTFVYRENYSLRPGVDIVHMRYFEISVFRVKQGHDKDWDELVKLVMNAYEKLPDAHWATFEAVYGAPDGTFVVFNPLKSLAETDRMLGEQKQFAAAMGEEGMRKLRELSAAAIDFSETNLFQFAPKMSYPPEAWINEDPDFWKPKPAAAPAPTTKKPVQKPTTKQ